MGLLIIAVILILLFSILSFYFLLNFIEHLQKKDERVAKQSKFAAIACFGIAMIAIVGFCYYSMVFYLM